MNHRLAHRADEYVAAVKSAAIGPSTEVDLIFHWVNQDGENVSLSRESMVPETKVDAQPIEVASAIAINFHVGCIIENIKRRILDSPEDYVRFPQYPRPVMIRDIDLEITQP